MPKSTLSGTQRIGLARGQRLEILAQLSATGFHADGVVVKPLSDTSLCFKTRVILRADNTSRLVEEYVRMFLRKYIPAPATKAGEIVAVRQSLGLENTNPTIAPLNGSPETEMIKSLCPDACTRHPTTWIAALVRW